MAAKWRAVVGVKPRSLCGLYRTFITSKSTRTSVNLRPEPYNFTQESIFTEDHGELRQSLNKFIEKEINPFVDEWENAESFPAHELLKKMGSAGFLGVNKPTEYGGMGLDYSFSVAMTEELGEGSYEQDVRKYEIFLRAFINNFDSNFGCFT